MTRRLRRPDPSRVSALGRARFGPRDGDSERRGGRPRRKGEEESRPNNPGRPAGRHLPSFCGPATRGALVALVVLIAGCSGTLVEIESSPATIPESALAPRGYVHGNTTAVPVTYPVGFAGLSRDVTVRTWVSGYSRTTTNDTAVLALYSSPNVEVAGRSVNPLGELSNRELVAFVLERTGDLRGLAGLDGLTDLREIGAQNVTVLEEPTRIASYAGTAEVDGRRRGVVVNVAVVEHGDDLIVALGVHDERLDERSVQAALLRRMEHGA